MEDREQPYYLDDYILPLRESHDNDKYIYNTCPVTKEELDKELDDYFLFN